MDVVKIGGSILFDRNGEINEAVVRNFLEYLKGRNIVLVVGCGSYLHNWVLSCALTDDVNLNGDMVKDVSLGYMAISKVVNCRLTELSEELSMHYCPVYKLFIKRSDGRKDRSGIVEFNAEHLTVPMITSGGIVPDILKGYAAIPSDTVAAYLAQYLVADRLIVFTDVDGVWDSMNTRILLRSLCVRKMDEIDLGGGMPDKIRRIKNSLINKNCKVVIANGYKREVISEVMNGVYDKCTQILL